jgi:hypothetical protein
LDNLIFWYFAYILSQIKFLPLKIASEKFSYCQFFGNGDIEIQCGALDFFKKSRENF